MDDIVGIRKLLRKECFMLFGIGCHRQDFIRGVFHVFDYACGIYFVAVLKHTFRGTYSVRNNGYAVIFDKALRKICYALG